MRLDRQKSPGEDILPVYMCDNCGNISNNTDYWWPGHRHWEECNYTLCKQCLVESANPHVDALEVHKEIPAGNAMGVDLHPKWS